MNKSLFTQLQILWGICYGARKISQKFFKHNFLLDSQKGFFTCVLFTVITAEIRHYISAQKKHIQICEYMCDNSSGRGCLCQECEWINSHKRSWWFTLPLASYMLLSNSALLAPFALVLLLLLLLLLLPSRPPSATLLPHTKGLVMCFAILCASFSGCDDCGDCATRAQVKTKNNTSLLLLL